MNGWFWNRPDVGLGQYLKWLVWGLLQSKEMVSITLIAPQPLEPGPEDVFGRLSPEINANNLTVLIKPAPFSNQSSHLSRLWFEQVAFPRACRALQPDIVHVPYYGAPLRPVKPQIITAHDLIPLLLPEYRQEPVLRLYGRLIASTLPKADRLISPSQTTKADLEKHLKIKPGSIHVIYEAPAPIYCQKPVHNKNRPKEELLLYVGGYEKRKNVKALVRAFHRAKPHLPAGTSLVLAGRLPDMDSAVYQDPRPLIGELGLEKDVCLPGWIPECDLPRLYRSAKLFVYPSRYEGFGLPVLEAMASGTAVLTTNAASLPEISGTAAALVSPDDIQAMSNQIIYLCTNETANQRLVQSGLNHVEQFDWRKTAAHTILAYQDIISSR
jgi:glycosyltransferase involved in cell wall biosynthesis